MRNQTESMGGSFGVESAEFRCTPPNPRVIIYGGVYNTPHRFADSGHGANRWVSGGAI